MIRITATGTTKDLVAFRKWIYRANVCLPKYIVTNDKKIFESISEDDKYHRWNVDLWVPLHKKKEEKERCAK